MFNRTAAVTQFPPMEKVWVCISNQEPTQAWSGEFLLVPGMSKTSFLLV